MTEAIIAIVGFLGAGKTTLLRRLLAQYQENGWQPFVILNDYENAYFDAQQLTEGEMPQWVKPLSGSCICCSGIAELRELVNRIPQRDRGVTLIEANGTTDACSLMGFLGVGIDSRFQPPVQISVVDVRNWQLRGEHNELEANQVQMSSLIVLTHLATATPERIERVTGQLQRINPQARVVTDKDVDSIALPELAATTLSSSEFDHQKAHWSSCSVDLPTLSDSQAIIALCKALPASLLRVKGCTRIGEDEQYTYFERGPDGNLQVRPFNGIPITGPKLLTVGPGSDPALLEAAIRTAILADNGQRKG